MRLAAFAILFFILISVVANSHSTYLFDISLDFDQELKSNVIAIAQDFLKTGKEPATFDLDDGLIMVHFEPEQRNYVEINPIGYKVHGMRNENLKHKSGEKQLAKNQGFEIAKDFFEALPEDTRLELKYALEVSEVDNTYFYKWFRHIDGIIVLGEDFLVNVDAVNGNIIAWRLSIFDYPKDLIETTPAITENVAKKIAELSFNVQSANGFEQYLVVIRNEPVWVSKLQGQFYPFFAGVNAKDGSIAFIGTLPGEVPEGYSVGNKMEVIETEFIKNIYESK